MRIGIDARKAADYGIGTYICSLTAHLVRQNPSCRWFLFHRPGDEFYTSLDKFKFIEKKWGTVVREVQVPVE